MWLSMSLHPVEQHSIAKSMLFSLPNFHNYLTVLLSYSVIIDEDYTAGWLRRHYHLAFATTCPTFPHPGHE